MKILLAEDNDSFAEALSDILTSRSYELTRVTSVLDAQTAFEKNIFDLIITDLHLKPLASDHRTSGIDIIHFVRQRKKSKIPIMVTTGLELIEARDIIGHGANIFFHKAKLFQEDFLPIIEYLLTANNIDHESIFHSISGLYLILNPDFNIVEVSEKYLQATLTRREEIMGRNIFKVFPDNPNDPTATGVKNLNASLTRVKEKLTPDTMAVQKYDIQKPESEGGGFEERYWSPLNSPVLDEQGDLKYIIHRVTDVTDFVYSKRHQEEQLKINNDLKERVGQMEIDIFSRAQEIQEANNKLRHLNQELDRTSQMLKDVNQELEAFSYSVSHDLRAPLRSIFGFSQALQEEYSANLDAQAQDYIQRIQKGTDRMGHLIDDLIRLAHFSKIQINYAEINLSVIAEEVLHELSQQDPDRIVIKKIPPNLVAQGDPGLLRAVLLNLLSNAWKFTKEKPETQIELGTTQTPEGKSYFVKDNGAGFDMKYSKNLFGAFQRLHTNKEFPGNGIGLATVRRIVTRHGGKTWAEGKINQGATVYFTLSDQKPFKTESELKK
jgi:signal transduction histidine kinase/DNA-binding response OmpR family regulator